MKTFPRFSLIPSLRAASLAGLLVAAGLPRSLAATATWDSDPGSAGRQNGSGTWSTSTDTWQIAGVNGNWVNGDNAVFAYLAGGANGGTITVSGTVQVGNMTFGGNPNVNYTFDSGTILLTSSTISASFFGATQTVNSSLAGSSGFTKTGQGNLNITADNSATLSGNVNVFGQATVNISTQGSLGTAGAGGGTLTVGNGTVTASPFPILALNYSGTFDRNVTLNSGHLESKGVNVISGTITVSGSNNAIVSNNGTAGDPTITGTVTGTGSFATLGDFKNTAFVGATLSYTGDTIVSGQNRTTTFNNTALPSGTRLVLGTSNNSFLSYVSFTGTVNQQVTGIVDTGTTANGGVVTSGTHAITLTINGTTSGTFKGSIQGSQSVIKAGSGTQTLSGSSNYSGQTTVNAGTLLVSGILSNTSGITVNGGTFRYTNGSAALNRNVTLSGGTFQYDSALAYSGSLTITSGVISGTGNLSTTSLTIGSNTTLSPGNSPGLLSTGSQTWTGGGNYNLQIFDATGVAGTGFDALAITGTLDLSGLNSLNPFNLNLWSLSAVGPDVNGDAINFNPLNNYSWQIATTTGGIVGFSAAGFDINTAAVNGTAGFSNTFGGVFNVSVVGNDLYLNYTAVPEPHVVGMFAGGLAFLLGRRRRSL